MSHTLPSLSQTEGLVVLGVVAVVAYAAFKAYKTGGAIVGTVSNTIVNAKNGVMNSGNRLMHSMDPLKPSTMDNRDVGMDETHADMQAPPAAEPEYTDPMGNISFAGLGTDTRIVNASQLYSPSMENQAQVSTTAESVA